jgi:outer membrane protein assembly factor BamB
MKRVPRDGQIDRHRAIRRLNAVGVRVIGYGGLLLLVGLFLADFRSITPPGRTPAVVEATTGGQSSTISGPGWPHLRGPHYNSTSDEIDLADSWPEEGPPVLWIRHIGSGYSGISAVGDRVFTQRQTLYYQSVLCMDGRTGATIWEHRYGLPYDAAGVYPGPRSTPTWHEGRIYFAGPNGLVGCLGADDGREVWSTDVNRKYGGRGTDFGYSASPLVEEGKVILPVGGESASVVALDVRDGSTAWASGDEPASYSSAIPITFRGRRHVIAFLENALCSFDLETGRLLWQQTFSKGYNEHAAMPLYADERLMIASPFRGGAEMYRIEPQDPEDPEADPLAVKATRVWFSRRMSNDVASSVLVDGSVYGFDLRDIQSKLHRPSRGEFRCLDLATGEVRWSSDRPGHAGLLAADGKLFMLNDSGEVVLAGADPGKYEELGRVELFGGQTCWTPPALHNGRLYLRSPTQAACLYVGRPEFLGTEELNRARQASEIPKSKRLDLSWLIGGEPDAMFDLPDAPQLRIWYSVCLVGVFGVAGLGAGAGWCAARVKYPRTARTVGHWVFWSTACVLGVAATPWANRYWPEFVFTWPATLFAAQQVVLLAVFSAGRQAGRARSTWLSMAAGLLFLGACLGYFHVLRVLSLPMLWVFLLGFLPSWPAAIPAARRIHGDGRFSVDLIWAAVAFSAYYWTVGAYIIWRAGRI